METKIKLSEVKKVYCAEADNKQRGFYAYLRRLQKDAAAAQADADAEDAAQEAAKAAEAAKEAKKRAADMKRAAKKDAAKAEAAAKAAAEAEAAEAAEAAAKQTQKQKAEAAKKAAAESAADEMKRESINALREVMQRKGLRAQDFNKDFLRENLPQRFNEAQQICRVSIVKDEDAAEAREKYASLLIERDGVIFCYMPQLLFTANSLLSLFTKAADAKKKAAQEAAQQISAADKERKKAEAAAKRYAEEKRRVEEYEAAQQRAAEAAKAAQK